MCSGHGPLDAWRYLNHHPFAVKKAHWRENFLQKEKMAAIFCWFPRALVAFALPDVLQ